MRGDVPNILLERKIKQIMDIGQKNLKLLKKLWIMLEAQAKLIFLHVKNASSEEITCIEFIDANGKKYDDWISAIKLE